MGFDWSWVNPVNAVWLVVDSIPVVGAVARATEAGILEATGDHAGAREAAENAAWNAIPGGSLLNKGRKVAQIAGQALKATGKKGAANTVRNTLSNAEKKKPASHVPTAAERAAKVEADRLRALAEAEEDAARVAGQEAESAARARGSWEVPSVAELRALDEAAKKAEKRAARQGARSSFNRSEERYAKQQARQQAREDRQAVRAQKDEVTDGLKEPVLNLVSGLGLDAYSVNMQPSKPVQQPPVGKADQKAPVIKVPVTPKVPPSTTTKASNEVGVDMALLIPLGLVTVATVYYTFQQLE